MLYIDNDIHPLDRLATMTEAGGDDPSCWEPEDFVKEHLKGSVFKIGETTYEDNNDGYEYITETAASIVVETELMYLRLYIEAEFWAVSKKVEVYWYIDVSDDKNFDECVTIDEDKIDFIEWPSVEEILQKIHEKITIFNTIKSLFV